jgi:hypothetical protein
MARNEIRRTFPDRHSHSGTAVTPSKRLTAASLFWVALFIPVNLLLQPTWFAVASFQPRLDVAPTMVALVKLMYFLSVCWGFYVLAKLWPGLSGLPSRAAAMLYRLAGLASIGALMVVHAPAIYRYGELERALHREIRATSQSMPLAAGPGVRMDQVWLGAREITYKFTLIGATASQMDLGKIREAIRAPLVAAVCADKKLTPTLSHGVTLRYIYQDKDGQPLADLALARENCVRTPG